MPRRGPLGRAGGRRGDERCAERGGGEDAEQGHLTSLTPPAAFIVACARVIWGDAAGEARVGRGLTLGRLVPILGVGAQVRLLPMPTRSPITVAIARFEDLLALGLRALLAEDASVTVVAQDIAYDRIPVVLRAHPPARR